MTETTAAASPAGSGPRRRGAVGVVVVVAAVVLVGVLAGRSGGEDRRALGPDSTAPDGGRALVELLEGLGADVDIAAGAPDADAGTAVVLDDRLDDATHEQVQAWVDAGGTILVADPSSTLGASRPSAALDTCPAAFDDVHEVVLGEGGRLVDERPSCADTGFTVTPSGDGWIVNVVSPQPFTNALLDAGDNAVLAAAVLAPTGAERVAFLDGSPGNGPDTLLDLVPTGVRQAVLQLGVAFVFLVLWAGRRLGHPVLEPQPVAVEGAELVAAVGRLLDGRHRPDEAAEALRAETRRILEARLGLPATSPPEVLAAAVHDRTGIDAATVHAAFARPVRSDADLVAVARELDTIRRTILGGPT
jgi:hypothetical protein